MYIKYKILAIFGSIVTLLSPQLILIAQEEITNKQDLVQQSQLDPSGVKNGELANCFDTYRFGTGSIDITAGTEEDIYKPYDAVEITGEIVNNNPYPIIDLTVRAKILRSHPNPVEQRALYTTVDDVIVLDNFILQSNQKIPLQYLYFVPGDAPTGDYIIQYYVYNQDRFNLNGLSFTEDIIANQAEFRVEGKDEHVYLDKTNITVGGKIHDTRAFITEHDLGKDIVVTIPLINPTPDEKRMEISYKLYSWDGILLDNLLEESIREINIAPNTKLEQEYIVRVKDHPVYYLEINSQLFDNQGNSTKQEKTMAHIRFAIPYNNSPRINWVGVNKNPFAEDQIELMTCIHNTSRSFYKQNIKVESIARDEKGRELTRIAYDGTVASNISGIKNKLNTNKKFNLVSIETNIYNSSNELIDNIITKYDCNEISPELCFVESNNILDRRNIIIILTLILLSISGVIISQKRHSKLKN
jgi:hypothetical protein